MKGVGVPLRFLDAWGDPLGREAATRVGTFAFVLLLAVVAFFDLGSRSLHNLDLPRFGVLAREMVSSGEWLVPHRYGEIYANKPPLAIWVIAAPASLVGEVTPFLVRLPSAIGLVLLVLSTSAWGRIRARSLAVGRTAALLLLGTYAMTRFGRESRPDMLASGLAIAATVLLDRMALGRGLRRDAWVAGLLLGLALLAKGPPLLILPLVVLLVPDSGRSALDRLRAARLHVVLPAALGVAALWFVPAVLDAGWAYGRELLFDQATDRIGGAGNHQEPWFYYARRFVDGGAPWTPFFLVPLLLVWWRGGRKALGATASLAVAALVVLVVFSCVPTKHVRYVLGVFPLLALPTAWLAVRLLVLRPTRAPAWSRLMRPVGGLLALVAAGVLVFAYVHGGLTAALVPAVGIVLLAVPAFGWRSGESPAAARRRLLGTLLVTVALLTSAYWIVRTRYRERALDFFDRAVTAAAVPGLDVLVLAPLVPDHVFHGLPTARYAADLDALPATVSAPGLQVLIEADRRDDLEARWGEEGLLLDARTLGDDGPVVLLLAFGPG